MFIKIAITSAINDLCHYRNLFYQLFLRDLVIRYRQSLFGYLWAIVPQILAAFIFYFLSSRRIVNIGQTELPYLLHALWGLSLWQYFSSCLVNSTNSLAKADNLIKKINFPKEILVFSSIAQPLVDFLIRLVPFLLFCLYLGFLPAPGSVLIVPILILVTLLALSAGLIFSLFNLVIRDISYALSLVLMVGIFLTPAIYPAPVSFPANMVNWVNPFSPLLNTSRMLLLGTDIVNIRLFMFTSIGIMLLFVITWIVFRMAITRVIERA